MSASFDWLDVDSILNDSIQFGHSLGLTFYYTIPLEEAVKCLLADREKAIEIDSICRTSISIETLRSPVQLRKVIDELKVILSGASDEFNCLEDLTRINPAIAKNYAYVVDHKDIYALLILDFLDLAFIKYKKNCIDEAVFDFGRAMAFYQLILLSNTPLVSKFPEKIKSLAVREVPLRGGNARIRSSEKNREHIKKLALPILDKIFLKDGPWKSKHDALLKTINLVREEVLKYPLPCPKGGHGSQDVFGKPIYLGVIEEIMGEMPKYLKRK